MTMRVSKACAIAVATLLPLALLWATLVVWRTGYDALAHALVVRAGKAHQEALLKARYFTPTAFEALRWLLPAVVVATSCLVFITAAYFDCAVSALTAGIGSTVEWVKASRARFARLRPSTKMSFWLLLGLQLLYTLVHMARIPVSYDEAWTYLNFTMRPVFISLSYYPAPNNHILFSVLTTMTRAMPLSPVMNMRFISLLFSLATTATLFWVGRRFLDESAMVLSACLFVFSFPVSLYAMQARGYAMLLFFSTVCFCSLVTFAIDSSRRSSLAAYCVASVLGFYTIPSFLYPFASISVSLLTYGGWTRQWRLVRLLVLADCAIVAAVLILYTPIFLVSGVAAVASNSDVQRLPLDVVAQRLPDHLATTAGWLCGVERGGIAIILAVAATATYLLRVATDRPKVLLQGSMLAILLLPPAIVIVHRTIPFERTWIYLLVPLCFLTAAIVERLTSRVLTRLPHLRWALPVAIVGITVLSTSPFTRHYDREFSRDFEADRLFAGIPSEAIGSIAYDDVYYADLLTYRVQLHRRAPVIARRLTPGTSTDADALVIAKGSRNQIDDRHDYSLWRQNEAVMVYLRHSPAQH